MLPPNLHLTYNDDIFLFQSDQFDTLRQATIAASFVAMISSFLVLVTFVYILVVDPKKANRISIRCVVIACTADGIDALFNILMSKLPGPQAFCRAAGIVANVMRLISASFLAIVGFNLVLIFVINVKRRDLLEYYYYPGAVLYVTVSAVVSIYFASTAPPVDAPFHG
ncbi:hypothetical protein BC940DRAFT_301261 [Gongronella butleri]|nr:hypothetical protein BC940DRAFT_301261 [Gongronella butleri]